MTTQTISPVHLKATKAPEQPTPSPALDELYRGFERIDLGVTFFFVVTSRVGG
jgi:hypothetical protein